MANLAVTCACILRFSYAFREGDSLPDAGAHIIDRLLVVLVLGRRLSRKPSRCGLNVVASALDLVDERLHVWCKAVRHQSIDIELLGRRMRLGLVKPPLIFFSICVHCEIAS